MRLGSTKYLAVLAYHDGFIGETIGPFRKVSPSRCAIGFRDGNFLSNMQDIDFMVEGRAPAGVTGPSAACLEPFVR
jgi:hypothetical protein